MDEPCSALDPSATQRVEELILERHLRGRYTILVVTHNMAQARRIGDECIFMLLGKVIEHRRTRTCSSPRRTSRPPAVSREGTAERGRARPVE
jgi:phosphate transport system ATP-binding protein